VAKNVSDREDLLRDARQMPIRGRANVDTHEVFVGFRSFGSGSLYFDQDPVFQFNSSYELRRVFFHDQRYAGYQGQLNCLVREDAYRVGPNISRLKLLPVPASSEIVTLIVGEFARIRSAILLQKLEWEFVGVESALDFSTRVEAWLKNIGNPIAIAASPGA
jgi:hypothetical protein